MRPAPAVAPATNGDAPDQTGSLGHFVGILWRCKWLLLGAALAGGLAAFSFTRLQVPVYQARAAIEIRGFNESFLNIREVVPTADSYFTDSYLQTQLELMKSQALLRRVAERLNLAQRPALVISQGPLARIRKLLYKTPAPKQPEPAELVAALSRAITVRPTRQTRIIEILCDSTDRGFAAELANALAEEYAAQEQNARHQAVVRTSGWLNEQLHEARAKLERSENDLQTYTRNSGLKFTGDQHSVAEDRLKQVQEELFRAQADRLSKETRFEMAQAATPESLSEVLDNPELKDYRGKLAELRRQVAELAPALTPANPRIQRLQSQISELQASMDKERANVLTRIRNEHQVALGREKMLAAEYQSQGETVTEESARMVHYDLLKREVESSRTMYETLLQRVKEAGIAVAIQPSNIRLVDEAVPPSAPYKPSAPVNTLLGFLGGLMLAVVGSCLIEGSDRSLRAPGDIRSRLALPELGAIPRVRGSLESRVAGQALRSAATSMLLKNSAGVAPRVLLFTSAQRGAGKTTLVGNLGLALARLNYRVLVIDADLHRPQMHRIFGLSNNYGLTDALWDSAPRNENTVECCEVAGEPGLHVLPSGAIAEDSSRLLYSDRLPALIGRLRRQFDVILIDTPPLLHLADARVISSHVDGAVLVVRAGSTTSKEAQAAAAQLREDGANVLGAVLSAWEPGRSSEYSGYYGQFGSRSSKGRVA